MNLDELRSEIDRIDTEITEQFVRRMKIAGSIAAYKKEHHLAVRSSGREEEILENVSAQAGPEFAEYTKELFRKMFELSRSYQEQKMFEPNRSCQEQKMPEPNRSCQEQEIAGSKTDGTP